LEVGVRMNIGDYVKVLHPSGKHHESIGLIFQISPKKYYPFSVRFFNDAEEYIYDEDELELASEQDAMLYQLENA
jgi:hypothetical protein